MRRNSTRVVVIAVVVAVIGIVGHAEARSYRAELRHVTERGSLYDGTTLDAKLLWQATLVTDDFRHARESRHVEINHLGAIEAARWIADEEAKQTEGWEFFITFYSKSDYQLFTGNKDSFWQARLKTTTGEEAEPTSVEMVPVTPYARVLYPHFTRWSRAYRVIFPKVDLGQRPTLTLQSVVGSSTLKWNLR